MKADETAARATSHTYDDNLYGTNYRTVQSALLSTFLFCAVLGGAMYLSAMLGNYHLFVNAFGVSDDPHLIRTGAMLFLVAGLVNAIAWYRLNSQSVMCASFVNGLLICHYATEAFIFVNMNWIPTAAMFSLLGFLVYTLIRERGNKNAVHIKS